MAGAAGMAELTEGLGLDLADTLTGDIKLLAHLLEGTGTRFYTYIFYTIFVNLSSEIFEHL